MTTYLVDVHEYVHTCPADPAVHAADTWQTVVAVIPGGPCQTPVTYRLNGISYTADCSFGRSAQRRCRACQVTIWRNSTTIHDDGAYHPAPAVAVDYGNAEQPCPVCHTPVAAFLGVHLLCGTRRGGETLTAARQA